MRHVWYCCQRDKPRILKEDRNEEEKEERKGERKKEKICVQP